MTAVDPSPRAVPEIGEKRYAADVRIGWHVQLPETGWTLVLGIGRCGPGKGDVQLTVRVGIRDEHTEQMGSYTRLPTRTPAEQIAWIEATRLGARGGGPVSRMHLDQQTEALVRGSAIGRCLACGAPTWRQEDGS